MLTSPHLIDGVRRKLLHVKSVGDDRGIRQTLRDGLLVRGGHIDRHRFNAFALLLADEVEEGDRVSAVFPVDAQTTFPVS